MRKISQRTEKLIAVIYVLFFGVVTSLFWATARMIGDSTATLYVIGLAFGLCWYPILKVIITSLKENYKMKDLDSFLVWLLFFAVGMLLSFTPLVLRLLA